MMTEFEMLCTYILISFIIYAVIAEKKEEFDPVAFFVAVLWVCILIVVVIMLPFYTISFFKTKFISWMKKG